MLDSLWKTRTFDREQYHRLLHEEQIQENDRIELIAGEICPMSPIGSIHAGILKRILNQLQRQIPADGFLIGVQDPIALGEASEPQPDLCVLAHRSDYYTTELPTPAEILLLVEVMVNSHEWDLTVKLPLYVEQGIPEIWCLDVPGRVWHICRREAPDGEYEKRRVISDEVIHPVHPALAGLISLTLVDLLGAAENIRK